ncbi:MAG: hypothetical protein Kow0062_07430 [Acidobacteriota bacterium]
MTRVLRYRLGELLGVEDDCSFVSVPEIERLLDGTLPQGRRRQIEAHAAQCFACRDLVDDVERFRLELAAAAAGGTRRRRPWRLFSLAASVVAIVGASFVSLPPTPLPVDPSTSPLAVPPAVRGASPRAVIRGAERELAAGRARRALILLERGLQEHPDDPFLAHDLGLVLLRLGRNAEAADALDRADRLQSEVPSPETRFWLAVALSRRGDLKRACRLLADVASTAGPRAAQARGLLVQSCPPQAP